MWRGLVLTDLRPLGVGSTPLHISLQLADLPAELSTEHQAVRHTPSGCNESQQWQDGLPQVAQVAPANAGDMGSIPGSGKSSGKEMAPHSSILAWEIPWTEEPGGLQSMGVTKELDTTERLNKNNRQNPGEGDVFGSWW